MTKKALLIGSIGVLAETSDIQRRAYNQALAEARVDWHWDAVTYRDLLTEPGGRERLRRLSAADGTPLTDTDIANIHGRKTALACEEILRRGLSLRPGVASTINQALDASWRVGLVTTTYRENIDAIVAAVGIDLRFDEFSVVMTRDDCDAPKPAPDIYEQALNRLRLDPADAIAVEDSAASVQSARAAGIYTIATPGEFTAGQDFSQADSVLASLEGYQIAADG